MSWEENSFKCRRVKIERWSQKSDRRNGTLKILLMWRRNKATLKLTVEKLSARKIIY